MNLPDLPAHQLPDLIRKREVSAVEALEAALERVEAVDGRPGSLDHQGEAGDPDGVHAFITLTAERAHRQPEEVDRRLDAGEEVGPLVNV